MAGMMTIGIVFRTTRDSCGCCGSKMVCAEDVHLRRRVERDADKGWSLIGPCDGTCRQVLPEEAVRLIRECKEVAVQTEKR